ncbi:MFS transporter [Cellulophaga lytica]|uniref:Major facilitator superfamily MFS_1 n=1 Tax=Cellulophaga lytica (strain ATCC 23178 / DSM 7489 / JCM 8516 / NBRC 14961 / NCIMB 1423 / VKM B-1433 / Cy l20) TaxID=867900 RepID=F0RAF3_CELLC|nr:MFS transporter [Cellulophaga lytica]ADY30516.1 major facilitator superfamily MFS_1 [Cellulophaga lytica DSM 7489]AIM61507.1 MFS transporter permease [Cellulophaga lytica]WQG78928.1 MFS transporter [Cellulophaga lytica]
MNTKKKHNWLYLFLLILSGEAVFILPFVLARVFRPTVLEVFNLTNLELGTCFSVYGFVAMASYLLGGPIADKFPPRKLIAVALFATALGGLVLASNPSYFVLKILYGYWGFTTIFLFWAPMIKATRVWGGNHSQGKAFGFLDGGRGLVGASFGALGVFIFSLFIIGSVETASLANRAEAFNYIVWVTSAIIIVIGIVVWFFLKSKEIKEEEIQIQSISTHQIKTVLKIPSVWLLMVIILCAYVGYKITDVFSLYAKDVMLYNEVKSAEIGTILLFIRPFIGILIGFIADKSKTTLWLIISFIFSILGALLFASGIINPTSTTLFMASILITVTGVYAVRSLYFATMQEGHIPLLLTGTAVGLISIIGYTPDIFAGPLMGILLDNSPGELGHQHVFIMLAIFSFIGLVASILFYRLQHKKC